MNKKTSKKVVFISHASDLYGAPRTLLLLLKETSFDNTDYLVICPSEGPLVNKLKGLGINTYVIHRNTEHLDNIRNPLIRKALKAIKKLTYFFKLMLFLYKKSPDLVYVNTIAHASPIIVARCLRIRTLVHVHESRSYMIPNNLIDKIRLFTIFNFPDRFICVSNAIKHLLIENGVSPEKITVIYNGVEIEHYKPSEEIRNKKRKELHLSNDTVLVGFVGRLIPKKGIQDFIKAAALVQKKMKNCKFIVVGGPLDSVFFKKEILSLCDKYNLRDHIIFTGFKEDVIDYLAAIDIFVNVSREEPFARVNLEAMAMGKPIIATNVDGNPEAIINGETGYIIPPASPDALADKIITLAKNEKLRYKFGQAGRKRVERYFTSKQYCENIYNEICMMLKD